MCTPLTMLQQHSFPVLHSTTWPLYLLPGLLLHVFLTRAPLGLILPPDPPTWTLLLEALLPYAAEFMSKTVQEDCVGWQTVAFGGVLIILLVSHKRG